MNWNQIIFYCDDEYNCYAMVLLDYVFNYEDGSCLGKMGHAYDLNLV